MVGEWRNGTRKKRQLANAVSDQSSVQGANWETMQNNSYTAKARGEGSGVFIY